MIEDRELRELFAAESAEHLHLLEQGLMRLEADPDDSAALDQVFREAHSLKGAARMLAITGVEALAHQLEEVFGGARSGQIKLSVEVCKPLFQTLDAIAKLVQEAISDSSANDPIAPPVITPVRQASVVLRRKVRPPVKSSVPDLNRFSTIRVEAGKIDQLMAVVGELATLQARMAHRVEQLEAFSTMWEEIARPYLHGSRRKIDQHSGRLSPLADGLSVDVIALRSVVQNLEADVRRLRMLPVARLFDLFPPMVRDLAREFGKEMRLEVSGGDVTADREILEEMKAPLMHLMRNAVAHGLESPREREALGKDRVGMLCLHAVRTPSSVILEVTDDGRGIDPERIRQTVLERNLLDGSSLASMSAEQLQSLIFLPGFSTSSTVTEVSGRGVGLDVVRTMVEQSKGSVKVESVPGRGTTFRLHFPIKMATARIIVCKAAGRLFALPLDAIVTIRMLATTDIFLAEGREAVELFEQPVPVRRLSTLLDLPDPSPSGEAGSSFPCIIIASEGQRCGLVVDMLVDEHEVVIKPLGGLLHRVRNLAGSAILETGEICLVLNAKDLVASVRHVAPTSVTLIPESPKQTILLVEDSVTTRTQLKRIMQGAGYEVVTAVNGLDALAKLTSQPFSAVLSDVQMPGLDGLALTTKLRADPAFREIPIILLTSLASDEDRRRGLEAGANAYIPKPTFDQRILLDTLRRLV